MEITVLYSDGDGDTHFRDQPVALTATDFAPPASPLDVSTAVAVERMVFIGVPAKWVGDWHPAPRRQYWVGVRGFIEVTVSDGETRRFGPGSVVLLEDVAGKGHLTRNPDDEPAQGLFVQTASAGA